LIVQLKDNQPTLSQNVEATCSKALPLDTVTCKDKTARSRSETRTVSVFDAKEIVKKTEWETLVVAIVMVARDVQIYNSKTGLWKLRSERSYYLSNEQATAIQFAAAIRGHWGIENRQHYPRDVTFGEDASRIRSNPGIFSRIRSFAYNILRINQTDTLPQERYRSALGGVDYLLTLAV